VVKNLGAELTVPGERADSGLVDYERGKRRPLKNLHGKIVASKLPQTKRGGAEIDCERYKEKPEKKGSLTYR